MSPASPPSTVSDPVSLVIRRRIRPGAEAAYETALKEGSALISRMPGHRGTGILRPAHGDLHYTLLIRFDSMDSAARWEDSPERQAWLDQIAPLVDEHLGTEHQPGLDFWFTPPGAPTLRQPPRWKMAVLTVLALYPISLAIGEALTLARLSLGLPLRVALQSVVVVLLMTYLVMPNVTRWASRWLRG